MSSSTREALTAAVITVSDLSGPAVSKLLETKKFSVAFSQVVPDEQELIQEAVVALASKVQLVVTTGGTGISARDVTPEATRAVCDRLLEGVPERMRFEGSKKTFFAALSRGVCGIRGKSLVLNLPGSPTGAVESLESVIDLLPHALQLLTGKTEHDGQT